MYFNKLEIETTLSRNEIIDKLNQLTFTSKLPYFKFNFTDKLFYGKISNDSFIISSVVKGKNSFVPIIIGEIINEGSTKIVLKMRLHYGNIILISFLTSFILFTEYQNFDLARLIFLFAILGMTIYNYKVECKKVKKIFYENFGINKVITNH